MLAFLDKTSLGTPLLRRIIFWLLTTFLAYVLIGFFVIPPVVKSVLIDQVTAQTNRLTTIDRLFFNPLTFRVEVDGFQIAKKEGEGALLYIKSFTAAPGIESVTEFAPVISYLHLRELVVDITFYGENKYSITDLIGRKQEPVEPDPATDEDNSIFPFALYGFELTDATIIFDDQPRGKKHLISEIDLLVPFTSSILEKRKEFTQPKFTATVNGDPVELKGRTLPFDDTLRTEFELGAVEIDLDQYWRYVPIESPLELVKGKFTSNISLFFERPEGETINLFLGGGGKLVDFELSSPKDGRVLALDELEFDMERFSLGDNALSMSRVLLNEPYFKVIRQKDNGINWFDYFPNFGKQRTESATSEPTNKETAAPFRVDAKSVTIQNGIMDWQDQAVEGGFKRTMKSVTIKANNFSNVGDTPLQFEISIEGVGSFTAKGEASVNPPSVKGEMELAGVQIPNYKAYLGALPMHLDTGTLDLRAQFEAIDAPEHRNAMVNNATVSVRDLTLRRPGYKQPSIGFKEFTVSGASMELATRTVAVDRVDINQPMVRIVRNKKGQIDLIQTFADAIPQNPATKKPVPPKATAQPWTASINQVRLAKGSARFRDYTLKDRAEFSLRNLRVNLDNISTAKGTRTKFDVSSQWGGGGIIATYGNVTLDTLASKGQIKLRKMGLKPFDPHLEEYTELLLTKGALSTDLKYNFSGMDKARVSVTGDVTLNDFQLKDNWGDGEFIGVDEFKLTSTTFNSDPMKLSIADIYLNGPRAVVEFAKNGQLNINRAFRVPEAKPTPKKDKEEKPKAAEADLPKEEKTPLFKEFEIGMVRMENGQVSFNDETVAPEFSTAITEMKLDLAEVAQTQESRPRVEFSAKIGPSPFTVSGVVNPVITPIYSDLVIALNGLEMVPLSSYTIQHLAYPIEKGRLYADVTFQTEDWELNASNKFFIEQLVLGPKDKRPDAPNIPVKFGLSLLQDSNGDMELNLPIEGRLDDPDFQIGGIIFKAIASLFVKALASPFTLIGSMFGGGEDMDFVVFKPGYHEIDSASVKKLETLAKAMTEREKLTLEVDGVIDPVADKQGLIEILFDNKIKQAKFDSLSRKERAETSVEAVTITGDEYEDLLFEVYADEPDPNGIKSTTLFITDRQSPEVMEKFVKDRIQITEEDLNELAQRRAVSVKEYFTSKQPELAKRIYLLDRRKSKAGKGGVPQHRADLAIK